MMDALDRFYQDNKIAAMSFECSHRGDCHSGNGDFVEAKEAFVGSEYVKGTLPRVLFISLDAASVSKTREHRTWPYIRDQEESHFDHKYHHNPHWRETHAFAFEILKDIARERHINLTTKPAAGLASNVCRYFAHTNSAKCKDVNRGRNQGRERFFNNCREFIPGEICILQPALIVTQGDKAHQAVEGAFPPICSKQHPTDPNYVYRILRINNMPVMWFKTYHPSCYGLFYRARRDVYPWCFTEARKFFNKYYP
ncbi:MAG: uracil-DNA glycosylase family protein [Dehalococcoidia bacterium]|jgi:hypothetical protein